MVPNTNLKPGQVVTVSIKFEDSRFVPGKKVKFDLKLMDSSRNVIIDDWDSCMDGVEFIVPSVGRYSCRCSDMTCTCDVERGMGEGKCKEWDEELIKWSYVEAKNGCFSVTAYCRVPEGIGTGKRILWAKPYILASIVGLKPATTEFYMGTGKTGIKVS